MGKSNQDDTVEVSDEDDSEEALDINFMADEETETEIED